MSAAVSGGGGRRVDPLVGGMHKRSKTFEEILHYQAVRIWRTKNTVKSAYNEPAYIRNFRL